MRSPKIHKCLYFFSDQRAQHCRQRPQREIHQAVAEKGVQVREQVCQAAEEGGRVQLPKPAEDSQEEGVHHGRRGAWGEGVWNRDCQTAMPAGASFNIFLFAISGACKYGRIKKS